MITGEMKNKVDSIWDTIWTGGITSPITVLEQITYLMFMKLLDDNQLKAEANANLLGGEFHGTQVPERMDANALTSTLRVLGRGVNVWLPIGRRDRVQYAKI